jgi:hypothetical protein
MFFSPNNLRSVPPPLRCKLTPKGPPPVEIHPPRKSAFGRHPEERSDEGSLFDFDFLPRFKRFDSLCAPAIAHR